MKKILFLGVTLIILSACNQSPEDKANVLIKESMKKMLYHADTYDPVETKIDSAFTPFDDPAFYEKTLSICKLVIEIEKQQRLEKNAKLSISIWGGPYLSAFGRNKYNEAKDNYRTAKDRKTKAEEKVTKMAKQLRSELEVEPTFIGYNATHRYRAQNNGGQTVFGETKFLFDKDIKQVISTWDMDKEEYKFVQILFDILFMVKQGEEDLDVEELLLEYDFEDLSDPTQAVADY